MKNQLKRNIYNIFIDEAGQTPYYTDREQPVLTLVGVVTKNSEKEFNQKVSSLLLKYSIENETEIHAKDIMDGKPPFNNLNSIKKQHLLFDFLLIGIEYIDFFHFFPQLKAFTRTKTRNDIKKRKKIKALFAGSRLRYG